MKGILNRFLERSGQTAERPWSLVSDSLARYNYAKNFCRGKDVLDVGTGFGFGAEFLAKNGARKVLGIDYNLKVISKALELNKLGNVSFRRIDALELDSLGEKFDVILAFEVIEHLPTRKAREFILRLYESIKPGGTLLLSTPNGQKSKYLFGKLYNPYHVKEYKKSEIEDLLGGHFSDLNIKGYRLSNKNYQKRNIEIIKPPIHKLVYVLGHFKLARELLAFIPSKVKHLVTKENTLPPVTQKDYLFTRNVSGCDGLFVIAKKGSVKADYNPLLSIVIPNYNGEDYLHDCLDSVLASSYKNFEVIVCDDGSSDGSRRILEGYKRKNRRIKLTRNRGNLGAAASRNKAFLKTKGEIIVFLDNDTIVDKNWLSVFVDIFSSGSYVGGVQALLLDLEKKELIQHAGGELMSQTGWLIPFHQWDKHQHVKKKLFVRNINAVSAALAVKRSVFERVNGFDEKEAVHSEDLDFSWRVWVEGSKMVLADKALVYHLSKSVSGRSHMGSNNFKIYFHLAKNSFRSFIKNYELKNVLRFLPVAVCVNLARGVLVLVRRGDASALFATISAIVWNIAKLANTLNERVKVQETRRLTDEFIMKESFSKESLLDIYDDNFKQTKLLW